jgi:hypothetical protein
MIEKIVANSDSEKIVVTQSLQEFVDIGFIKEFPESSEEQVDLLNRIFQFLLDDYDEDDPWMYED